MEYRDNKMKIQAKFILYRLKKVVKDMQKHNRQIINHMKQFRKKQLIDKWIEFIKLQKAESYRHLKLKQRVIYMLKEEVKNKD